jgi:alkaline phosphatase D
VGRTRLAPGAEGAHCARFAVVSCSSLAHGYFFAYRHIADRPDIDAVLHLGDYIYEYGTAKYGTIRPYEPEHEIVTLDDYRTRYKQYRRDPDLQKIHQAHPMYNVWDDHESANDSYAGGAQNHQEEEGDWEARKEAARRAYFEWLPIRDTLDGRIWRSFSYGELADLIFLDTRIAGRDEQIGNQDEDAPERHILGDDQEAWLEEELATGKGHWQIIGQQVMVAQLMVAGGAINMDQWDGYTFARDRFFDMLEKHTHENVVVLTGDIHTSWVWQLARDPYAADWDPYSDFLGVEFVVPGISSPGLTAGFNDLMGQKIKDENPHLKWNDLSQRGYMILDLTKERVQADWYLLDGILAEEGNEFFATGWAAAHGNARLREMAAPVMREAR